MQRLSGFLLITLVLVSCTKTPVPEQLGAFKQVGRLNYDTGYYSQNFPAAFSESGSELVFAGALFEQTAAGWRDVAFPDLPRDSRVEDLSRDGKRLLIHIIDREADEDTFRVADEVVVNGEPGWRFEDVPIAQTNSSLRAQLSGNGKLILLDDYPVLDIYEQKAEGWEKLTSLARSSSEVSSSLSGDDILIGLDHYTRVEDSWELFASLPSQVAPGPLFAISRSLISDDGQLILVDDGLKQGASTYRFVRGPSGWAKQSKVGQGQPLAITADNGTVLLQDIKELAGNGFNLSQPQRLLRVYTQQPTQWANAATFVDTYVGTLSADGRMLATDKMPGLVIFERD